MPTIKRYANRKLYDTQAKRYVTLDGLADLIRQGKEVHVVEHATGADITPQIQAQIIFEEEKKLRGGLPLGVLTGLIRTGSDTLQQLRQALGSGAGWRAHVDSEIERRLQSLVERGIIESGEADRWRELLFSVSDEAQPREWPADDELQTALAQRDVPTRADLRRLSDKLESLTAEVERLRARKAGRGR